jgi:hypothetical protein
MNSFDVQNLTINTDEAQDISKAVFEYVLETSDLAEHHDIHTGIQWDTQIPFIGTLGLVGKQILKCKPDANGNKIPLSEKKWSPKLIGDRFEHCAVDGDPLFKLFKKVKNINPDFYNRINSEELGIVLMRIAEAMKEMLQRIVWFGDKNAETFADGGVFTNGTDLDFFNPIDGLWKQILSIDIPVTSKYYVKIDANDEPNYVNQSNLPQDFAFNLFRQMWKKADPRLKQLVAKGTLKVHIHATSAIAENWQDYKEDKSLAFTIDRVEGGGLKDFFRNIVIVPRYDWDSIIEDHQDNGTKLNLPHRALLTTAGNIPIGTVSVSDLETVKSFYDEYHEVNVMDFRLKLDAKFLEDYLAVAAY